MTSLADLHIPDTWPILVAFDTGTYCSALFSTFCPDPVTLFALAEFPNYDYAGGEIELTGMSNTEWAHWVLSSYQQLRPSTTKVTGWVDENSQFKAEFAKHGLILRGNPKHLELRVEITREYVQSTDPPRFYMAPWLKILPYEMEHAQWPDEATVGGRFVREKRNDHTLDCLEHIASRRPRAKVTTRERRESFLERYLRENPQPPRSSSRDPHLGRY